MARKKNVPKVDETTAGASREVILRLDGDLTIRDVAARRDEWRALLDGASSLTVDAGAIQRIDTAGLQLLVALRASAQRRGVECRVTQPSGALVEAVATVGLGPSLGIDAAGWK